MAPLGMSFHLLIEDQVAKLSFLVLCKSELFFFKHADNQDINPFIYTGDLMNILFHSLCIGDLKIIKALNI